MNKSKHFVLFLLCIFLSFSINAQETETNDYGFGMAVAVKAGTWGAGGDLVFSLSKMFSIRAGGGYLRSDITQVEKDLDIKHENKIGTAVLLGNAQVAKNLFISAGLVYNFSEQTSTGQATSNQQIGVIDIGPNQIGTLSNTTKWNKFCPYLGVGLGKAYSYNSRVFFAFEVGAYYVGSPSSEMKATGMVHPTANESNQAIIENNLKDATIWPVVNLQLGFRIL